VILFDSTVLIDHLKGVDDATDLVSRAIRQDIACCSALSRVEIEGGMRSGERFGVRQMFGQLIIEPVTSEIAGRAAELMREYRRSHGAIDIADYVIAATAQARGAQLMTLNVKHFPMFASLTAAY